MTLILFLKSNQGFLFFPISLFVVSLLLWKEPSLLLVLCLFFLFIRVYFLKRKTINYLCCLAFCLSVICHVLINKPAIKREFENQLIQIELIPDTIKIDGDLMTFEGRELRQKSHVLLTYRLKSELEKEEWQKQSQTVIVTGRATTQVVPKKRNINGFDYNRYLDITGIDQKLVLNEINNLEIVRLSFYHPIKKIKEFRRKGIIYTESHFLPVSASYIEALLFGYQNSDSKEFRTTWQELGVAHLFSLSGMHIYFYIILFEWLFLYLGMTRDRLFYYSLGFILSLVVLTGMGTGMIRAALQWLIKTINKRYALGYTELDCWSLALLINCLIMPYVLLTVGGQLTYYLTFLIIMIQPRLSNINNLYIRGWCFSALLSFLSLPLIWSHFYEWNLLIFLLNSLLAPVIFLVVLPLLLLSFVFSFIVANHTFIWLENLLLIIQQLASKMNQVPFMKQVIGKPPLFLVVVVMISQWACLVLWEKNQKFLNKTCCYILLIIGIVPFWKFMNPRGLIAFIDVGQGDALFVQLPFHKGNYLLDTGGVLAYNKEAWQQGKDNRGADYTVIPFLKSKGVNSLDAVFISHAHEDHFGDLDRISEEISVKQIIFGPGTYEQANFYTMLQTESLIKSQKRIITSQDSFRKGEISLDCLYPFKTGDGQNNDSLVLKLVIKNRVFLLMGDLEKEGENELLQSQIIDLSADVLKAGHHGSKTSSQLSFLEAVNPNEAVISCGVNNRYQHPSLETLSHFEELKIVSYRTDLNGMIYQTWWPWTSKIKDLKSVKK